MNPQDLKIGMMYLDTNDSLDPYPYIYEGVDGGGYYTFRCSSIPDHGMSASSNYVREHVIPVKSNNFKSLYQKLVS